MNPTLYEINVAIIMMAVSIALLVWFQRSEAAASVRRMMGMMKRVGLDSRLVASTDPRTKAIMEETRRRCASCRAEDFCDRWLAGQEKGPNIFCPNARTFGVLTKAIEHTA